MKPLDLKLHKFKAGQEIEVGHFLMNDGPWFTWAKATIVEPVKEAPGCYEVMYPDGSRSIINEYLIKDQRRGNGL